MELKREDVYSNSGKIFDFLDVSESTRKDYKSQAKAFFRYAEKNGFNRNTFLEYKRHLSKRNDYSISTKNKYLISAKIFLKELNRQGILPEDITQNIKTFKQDKKHKKDGINDNEVTQLTEKLKQLPITPYNARLKAVFSLLILQGLRQCEVIRLDYKDLDFANNIAMVRGKGCDDKQPVHLHPETVKILKEYLKVCRIADGALLVSYSNNSKGKRLSTWSIRMMVKKAFADLGIEKSTHSCRHYFTTSLIKNYKGDLLEVARYTRHKSLEMLTVYNDNINQKADLPRYYKTFENVVF